jgi:Rrf2 family iron-sulfur cluster assembly transcriptional regulator
MLPQYLNLCGDDYYLRFKFKEVSIMKLSTKARYAITAMMDLALHENERTVTLAEISQYQGISLSYLEQLFAKLRSKGLVSGVRGPGGGYRLSKPADEISLTQIVRAINDTGYSSQVEVEVTGGKEENILDDMWEGLTERLYAFMDNISLGELVKEHRQSGAETRESGIEGIAGQRSSGAA